MAFTQNDLDAILNDHAQEGLYLELKRGAALGNSSDQRNELVKDCIGFANASGGTILYGIQESQVDGVNAAAGLSPVPTNGLGKNWITEVLRSNTSPPLTHFEITELPLADGSGKVVAIEIETSYTAHQSLRDHKYYQRSGVVTSPMVDFQIRDVMGRRQRPAVQVTFQRLNLLRSAKLHRYQITAEVTNSGNITLEKWAMQIDLPASAVRDTRNKAANVDLMRLQHGFDRVVRFTADDENREVARITIGDPDWNDRPHVLHPGQSLQFESRHGDYPQVFIEIDESNWHELDRLQWPIRWRIFAPNHQPLTGEWSFQDWCNY